MDILNLISDSVLYLSYCKVNVFLSEALIICVAHLMFIPTHRIFDALHSSTILIKIIIKNSAGL